ncbi:MAG: sulfatase [Verrucomicrobia bacterium]|nr:sulfatase [Verrucomicrobiota bacterium]
MIPPRARRLFVLPALLAALSAPLVAHAATPPPARPNVLLIVVDDLNVALGCYGNRDVKSPNIDRLAARGVRFERAYSQYPLCNPSRVSFLSGRRPETSGVYILNTPARTALPDAVMLPQFFRRQGYYTAGAGKVFHSVRTSDQASWDRYEDGPGEDAEEREAIQARYGGGDGRPRWHVLSSDGAKTRDGLNARTIQRLLAEKSQASSPFFLALGLHKPHLPWTAPKRFFDLYPEGSIRAPVDPAMQGIPAIALQTELSGFAQPESRAGAIRAYYACISFIDHELGLVLDELERRDLWKDTLVVFFSDHGFHLGDHGGLWAKLSAFDFAIRTPLLFAGPGVPAGRAVSTPVELLDVYPTLLELAGFPPPVGLEGQSLRPLFENPRADRHAFSLVYHYDVAANRDIAGRTVVGAQWRYTEWDSGAAGRELYWRADDPGEYRNRAADPMLGDSRRAAERVLGSLPAPKAGPANRPRALDPAAKKKQ